MARKATPTNYQTTEIIEHDYPELTLGAHLVPTYHVHWYAHDAAEWVYVSADVAITKMTITQLRPIRTITVRLGARRGEVRELRPDETVYEALAEARERALAYLQAYLEAEE